MSWFFSAIPCLLAIGTIVLGLLALLKEWEEYKNPRLRIAVGCVLVIVGLLTVVSLYLDSKEKREAASNINRLEGQVKGLEGEVKAANTAQKENTQLFLDSFKTLSERVSELQTQVKTEALQKKLATVEEDQGQVFIFDSFPFL